MRVNYTTLYLPIRPVVPERVCLNEAPLAIMGPERPTAPLSRLLPLTSLSTRDGLCQTPPTHFSSSDLFDRDLSAFELTMSWTSHVMLLRACTCCSACARGTNSTPRARVESSVDFGGNHGYGDKVSNGRFSALAPAGIGRELAQGTSDELCSGPSRAKRALGSEIALSHCHPLSSSPSRW